METTRLITSDTEFLTVSGALLVDLKENIGQGKMVVFSPSTFVLPEEKEAETKDEKKLLIMKTGKTIRNFSFETEERQISEQEALRQLGVTLYHLATGRSEHTHECFLLDGYRRPLNSALWPTIDLILKGEIKDAVTVEQMLKELNPDDLQPDIQPPAVTVGATGKTTSAENIIRDLSGQPLKIIGHEGAANFWSLPVPQGIVIRYNEASIREAVEMNRSGSEQWALAYYSGQSIRQMRAKLGTDKSRQPCFYDQDWYMQNKEDFWADKNLEPGYYLLNYNGKFASTKWNDQESQIASTFGVQHERCHEFIVGETILTNFNVNGGERLLENWYHWGKESDSDGNRVGVGGLGSGGLSGVRRCSPGDSDSHLRVVVLRKFDF